jgi:hypothetical protein
MSSWPIRALRSFGQFWWDFLIGETPELFVAAIVLLGLVALISVVGHDNTLALVLLPLLCVVALGASLLRASRGSRGS